MMTTLDVVPKKKPEPSAEETAAKELVRLAREQGLSLTGPDGLLKQFTKSVLETALNEEMKAAGVRVFVGGLQPAGKAKAVRLQPGGTVLVTDGPYIETKEHIGGFWVLEAVDVDEALAWGSKAAIACRAPVEVRPFN